jgi:hypothetical protein
MSRARDLGSSINSTVAGKNFIINGGMDIAQRGASLTGINGYCLDRWFLNGFGTSSNISVARNLISGLIPDVRYYMRIAPTTSSTQNFWLNQTIETDEVIKLAGKTATLSFWYRMPFAFTGIWSASVVHSTAVDTNLNFPTSSTAIFADNLSGTAAWQKYTKTFVVPATANSLSVQLQTTNNVLSTAMFDITGVQLEIGSSATQFSRAGGDIQGELTKCQRYYQTNYPSSFSPGSNMPNMSPSYDFGSIALAARMVVGGTNGANRSRSAIYTFPVEMRSVPTIQYWDWVGNASRYSGGNFDSSRSNDNLSVDAFGGPVPSNKGLAFQTVSGSSTITYSAIMWAASSEL